MCIYIFIYLYRYTPRITLGKLWVLAIITSRASLVPAIITLLGCVPCSQPHTCMIIVAVAVSFILLFLTFPPSPSQ